MPGQKAQDCPDLVTRIFCSKYEELKKDAYDTRVLGKVIAHAHVVEFKKKGDCLMFICSLLVMNEKLNSPEDYDRVVRAEIPDLQEELELHNATVRHMIHGPCGRLNPSSPCMKHGSCKNTIRSNFI